MYTVMGKRYIMVNNYTFKLTDKFLSVEEQLVFDDYLNFN